MRRTASALVVFAITLAVPAAARAQGYFVPNIGYDFGGSAGDCPSLFTDCGGKRVSYGVTFGALVGGIIGFEEDIAYAPDFFGSGPSFGTNNVLTAMTNLVIAIPAGPVRPYVTGGVGLVRTRLDVLATPPVPSVSDNAFGYDFGGGVMIFLPHHCGIRGELRYLRSINDISFSGFSFSSTNLNFARATIGFVLH
jgi:opacity protein-like surface antigen